MNLPQMETLLLEPKGPVLQVTFNRPQARNAMSLLMVQELTELFPTIADSGQYRAVVLRGAGGQCCAGAVIKVMATARADLGRSAEDPICATNRAFGRPNT